MPGGVQDAGDVEIDKMEKVPVLTNIVNWSLICTNILVADVVQRQQIFFQSCPNLLFPCDDGEFIYDKDVKSECRHIKVRR